MKWELSEAVEYYKRQGAPGDQSAVIALLREIQQEKGAIPREMLTEAARGLGVKEGLLLALVKRIPSLRLADSHILEVCSGKNCQSRGNLQRVLEEKPFQTGKIQVKYVPCMRQCGKGPNVRWDGTLYHAADEKLLRSLAGLEAQKRKG